MWIFRYSLLSVSTLGYPETSQLANTYYKSNKDDLLPPLTESLNIESTSFSIDQITQSKSSHIVKDTVVELHEGMTIKLCITH